MPVIRTTRLSRRRLFLLGLALAIIGFTAAALAANSSTPNAKAAVNAPPTPHEKSIALTKAPSIASQRGAAEALYPKARLREAAKMISIAEIPVPPGLDTAATLPWDRQVESLGEESLPESDVRFLLQTNAFRDWVWFAAHNELTDEQRAIVEEIPQWPAFRTGARVDQRAALIKVALGPDREAAHAAAARLYPDTGGKPPASPAW